VKIIFWKCQNRNFCSDPRFQTLKTMQSRRLKAQYPHNEMYFTSWILQIHDFRLGTWTCVVKLRQWEFERLFGLFGFWRCIKIIKFLCHFTGPKKLSISRPQSPPTCPRNGCCTHQKHYERGRINHRCIYS
jgi:hypothetical protein